MKLEKLEHQVCPVCHKKTLTLTEGETEVPYFGKVYVFGMDCSNCDFKKHDVEAEKPQGKVKYSLEISSEDDMNIRVVKSSAATIKIPRIFTIEPGPASEGYITNIEGIFQRAKEVIQDIRDNSDDGAERKKAKNLLKKIQRIMWGQDKIKITLEDPTGNSAIVSEKAKKSKL